MKWSTAKDRIANRIQVGADLNSPLSTFRKVLEVDASIDCPRFDYKDEQGFVVRIGKKHKVEIPWSMLETCFAALSSATGYSGVFFRERFGPQAREHPCHVHVVGQLFVKAGIAVADGPSYRLLQNEHSSSPS